MVSSVKQIYVLIHKAQKPLVWLEELSSDIYKKKCTQKILNQRDIQGFYTLFWSVCLHYILM